MQKCFEAIYKVIFLRLMSHENETSSKIIMHKMKKSNFFSIILFISGTGLSLVTNLVTSDEKMISFYQDYKKEVLYVGIGLIILSILLTFSSEASESKSNNVSPISGINYLTRVIIGGISKLVIGVLIGLIIFWSLDYFQVSEYIILVISSILAGAIAGYGFTYLDISEEFSVILGGIIGFAASYYFTEDFIAMDFLPFWLNKKTIVVSGIISMAIGFFTAPSKITYDRKRKQKTEEEKKNIEKFEIATARLKMNGMNVQATGMSDQLLNYLKLGLDKEQLEKLEKLRSEDKVKALEGIFNFIHLPGPPYCVLDNNGKELYRFSSLEAFVEFSRSLSK
ncbi:MAG: hypothetical protein ACKV1O_25875 [Saprospiraceae bacterium]